MALPPLLSLKLGWYARSILQRAQGQATHEVFLDQQDEDEAGKDGGAPQRRDESPLGPGGGDERRDLDRDRADAGCELQRKQELRPGEDETQDRGGGEAAAHQRQHDPGEALQTTG